MVIANWGLVDYHDAWQKQRVVADDILERDADDTLALCEHPSVITLGRTTQTGAVKDAQGLSLSNVPIIENDRGGEATVHNPGQLVGYPIFNLKRTKPDLHWFLRSIEESIIDALSMFAIHAHTVKGLTGVWVGGDRKICAIGIHCRKWITTHGFALNVNNDLSLFSSIIPCGIPDKKVTSMLEETGIIHNMSEVSLAVSDAFLMKFSGKMFDFPLHQNNVASL